MKNENENEKGKGKIISEEFINPLKNKTRKSFTKISPNI